MNRLFIVKITLVLLFVVVFIVVFEVTSIQSEEKISDADVLMSAVLHMTSTSSMLLMR
jgi:hypothetical protein